MSVARSPGLTPFQGDDTYAWRVRKVVDRPWIVGEVDAKEKFKGVREVKRILGTRG
jgi:hypothetical protein